MIENSFSRPNSGFSVSIVFNLVAIGEGSKRYPFFNSGISSFCKHSFNQS